jgi:hypothetical protein
VGIGGRKTPTGLAVSDAQAQAWSERVRDYTAGTAVLKHWCTERMPATYREGLVFVDDSQQFFRSTSCSRILRIGASGSAAPVMYQFGYVADGPGARLADPPADSAKDSERVVQHGRLFWVDFTLRSFFLRPLPRMLQAEPGERATYPKIRNHQPATFPASETHICE